MKRRPVHVVVVAFVSLLLLGPVPNSLARPLGPRLVGKRVVPNVDVPDDAATGYGTGTVIHADALRAGAHSVLGLDVAFSGAAFSSEAAGAEFVNEVRRRVAPKLDINNAFGRGAGLELGIAAEPTTLIGQLSEAKAPASTELISNKIGPIVIPNILRAELLRSQAQARAAEGGCVLGPDHGYGLGSVLNLEVLGGLLATNARPPSREVSQSSSITRIVNGSEPGRLGLESETRQTIAPVPFFKGAPFQFTVEVLGEWVLRAVADGKQGSVHYGPNAPTPETPVVRILGARGDVLGQLTTQMLLGHNGLEITIPGVAEIVVGEDPRMIGEGTATGPTVSPTAAIAAVDVVRVRLLDGQLADVRIGHMEAAVTVPAGGVDCPDLTVDQTVDKPTVTPGEEFTYTIAVTNPHDCVLTAVKVVETPRATAAGVKFELVSVAPSGATVVDGVATVPDISPLGPGESKTVTVKVKIPADSAAGPLDALAVATGICPVESVPSTDDDGNPSVDADAIPVRGEDKVDGPTVTVEVAGPLCTVPAGTDVDLKVAGPVCTVPSLVGMTEADARAAVDAQGCTLRTDQRATTNPAEVGKVTTQNPAASRHVPKGSAVDVTLGVQVLGETAIRTQTEQADGAALALARTGGVAFGGLALWLLLSGLVTQTAGSTRLSPLVRRLRG